MMRRIVASSLKFRRLIVALAIGLIAVGVTQVGNIPVDQLPEFGPTMVEVRTIWLRNRSRYISQERRVGQECCIQRRKRLWPDQ